MFGIKRQYIIEAISFYRNAYPDDNRTDEEIWEIMKTIEQEPRYKKIMFLKQVNEGLIPVERLKRGY